MYTQLPAISQWHQQQTGKYQVDKRGGDKNKLGGRAQQTLSLAHEQTRLHFCPTSPDFRAVSCRRLATAQHRDIRCTVIKLSLCQRVCSPVSIQSISGRALVNKREISLRSHPLPPGLYNDVSSHVPVCVLAHSTQISPWICLDTFIISNYTHGTYGDELAASKRFLNLLFYSHTTSYFSQ